MERYCAEADSEVKANARISKELIENLFIFLLFRELIKLFGGNSKTVVIYVLIMQK
jgi:hypothetical protein